jgi:hypothetical protein
MAELKRLFLAVLVAFVLILGWLGWWILQHFFKEFYFVSYPLIPSFFFVWGIVFINVLVKSDKTNPRRLANIYMILKLIKIFLSLIIVAIYLFTVKSFIREFSLVFVSYYIINIGVETYFFYRTEQHIKKNNENEVIA